MIPTITGRWLERPGATWIHWKSRRSLAILHAIHDSRWRFKNHRRPCINSPQSKPWRHRYVHCRQKDFKSQSILENNCFTGSDHCSGRLPGSPITLWWSLVRSRLNRAWSKRIRHSRPLHCQSTFHSSETRTKKKSGMNDLNACPRFSRPLKPNTERQAMAQEITSKQSLTPSPSP